MVFSELQAGHSHGDARQDERWCLEQHKKPCVSRERQEAKRGGEAGDVSKQHLSQVPGRIVVLRSDEDVPELAVPKGTEGRDQEK